MGKKYYYVDSPLYKIECTARICKRYFSLFFKEKFSEFDLTEGEFCIMDTIVRSPEITQIELARLLCKGRAHITQMLSSLESKGFVERTQSIKNSRHVRYTVLTPSGTKIYNFICDKIEENFEQMSVYLEGKEALLMEILDGIKNIITKGENIRFE